MKELPAIAFLACASLAILLGGNAAAELYKYKDHLGVEHIRERPVPGAPETPGSAPGSCTGSRSRPSVEIYVRKACPWSRKAVEYFAARGIPFAVFDIEMDTEARRRKNELDPDRGVPTVVIGGKVVHGYAPAAYGKLLGRTAGE